MWRCGEPEALVAAFAHVPLLYVADGHHRSASASRARAHFRERNPAHTGDEEYNRVLATVFPAGQLRILPYNRVVSDLNGQTAAQFKEALGALFPLRPDAPPAPERAVTSACCVAEATGCAGMASRSGPARARASSSRWT